MNRATSLISATLLFIWILPLGAFIKPDKEKEFCNGRRAICLCSHLLAKKKSHHLDKISNNNTGSTQKENGSSSSHYFLLTEGMTYLLQKNSLSENPAIVLSSFLVFRLIDPVPKSILS